MQLRDARSNPRLRSYFMNAQSPGRLARVYGAERLKRTAFVVLLCDPVQRTQSAFCECAPARLSRRPIHATTPLAPAIRAAHTIGSQLLSTHSAQLHATRRYAQPLVNGCRRAPTLDRVARCTL